MFNMPNPNLPINYRKNTYIGARYVPVFASTPGSIWDNSISYEPLTIVIYQGNSYTSKTFVPVGVDINNQTYWAQSGNYNAQVEAYRQEVEDLRADVENNETAIQNNANSISEVKENLKTGLVAIGNSYLEGGIFNLISPYYDYAIKATADGAGFATYAGHSETYYTLLNNLLPNISNKKIITDVLFVSAWGDTRAMAEGTESFESMLNSALSKISTLITSNFPNVRNVYIAYAEARNFTNQTSPNTPMWAYYRTHQAFMENCYKYGCRYLGALGWELMSTNNFLSDGYHPNSTGNKYLTTKILQRMHSYDEYTPLRFNSTTFTYTQDGEVKNNGEISLQMTPEHTSIIFNPHATGTARRINIILSDQNASFIKIAPLIPTGVIDSFWIGNVRCVVENNVGNSQISFQFSEEASMAVNFVYSNTFRLYVIK